ncbi:hypothetical protein ACS0TY_006414 [Phlomoides rotata]
MLTTATSNPSKMRYKTLNLIFLLHILSYSSYPLPVSTSQSDLQRGHSLSVGKESDFIISPDNTFTCGFHSLGTNAYWFAIWFTNSRDRTVVWTANRDTPVNGKGSKVTIKPDGTMVLTDVDGSIVWQTNTDAASAELLSTGNLVLKNTQGKILWQSFGFPTDTLLPSQTLTKNSRLVSALGRGSFASGYFALSFDSNNVLKLISDTPDASTAYWPNPDFDVYRSGRTNYNSSRVARLDDKGSFRSSDQLQFNTSDTGYGIKRRLTIDYDGNLRVYSLKQSTGLWDITWQALTQPCSVLGVCGRNALCVYAHEPKCTCVPGFEVTNSSDWNLGCKATFNQTHLNSRKVKFLEIPHTDFYGFDLNATSPVTLETCREICLNDFRCKAFSYRLSGQGVCYVKSELLNGYENPDFPGAIYLKLPEFFQAQKLDAFHVSSSNCGSIEAEVTLGSPSMYDLSNKRARWVEIYSFAAALGATQLMFILIGWWFLWRKNGVPASVEAGYRMISSQFRRYTYAELKKATKNFTEEIGRGGSGTVYRGLLPENRAVAVKKLGGFLQGQEEYFAEISTIGKINNMNLVRIWGFCSDKRHRILVYEYLENLSLDRHLFGSNFLGWERRYAVALGTAKGLAYLHHECLEWIIHCDVKPENILLDGDFQPKISDFGFAKLAQRGNSGAGVSRIRGTKGYMAPEWALNHPITAKVDVFGYGVVILEMVRGIRVCDWVVDDDDDEGALKNFVRRIEENMRCGSSTWVESVVDPRLEGEFSRNQAAALIQVGISCVENDRKKRPTMAYVLQTLLECEDETQVTEGWSGLY